MRPEEAPDLKPGPAQVVRVKAEGISQRHEITKTGTFFGTNSLSLP
jgi:hypothetical protein